MGAREQLLNDAEEATLTAMEGNRATLWTALPCIVISVNWAEMTLQLQSAIQGEVLQENGTTAPINLPPLPDVPICFPSAGGFTLTMPIKPGDEVLGVFSSRCIDAWWSLGGVQPAIDSRMHDLSDCFAIPGPKSKSKVISAISTTDAQLRNDAGTAYISITADGKIKLVASEIDITGDLKVSGEVTAGTIPLTTHIHPGVQTGGGNTGAAIP